MAVVIPPWNFPLAIPCGMTAAALVTGNTVVLEPAEQSAVIAWQFVKILLEAGVPEGAIAYLPGRGEEAGQALVNHPGVNLIAFTGSRDVGLLINRQAAEHRPGQDHVKRVIAEMGGKNAIIVDDDADLDEAVVGVVQSAFGYSGQKCSACSRVIVLEGAYDAFLSRLVEAARAIKIGPAADPETLVGPVIDAEARRRILDYRAGRAGGSRRARFRRRRSCGRRHVRRPADRRRRPAFFPNCPGGDLRTGSCRPQGRRHERGASRSPMEPRTHSPADSTRAGPRTSST